MFRTLLPAGRIFGVDLRIHLSFPILFALALVYGVVATGNAVRGLGLWLALILAVVVREGARALAALYAGLDLRAIFLLPIGGVMAFAPGTSSQAEPKPSTKLVTVAGPVANTFCGLLLMAGCYALVPDIHLFTQPWFAAEHVLRTTVWIQFAIAMLGVLPSALPMRPVRTPKQAETPAATPSASAAPIRGFVFRFNVGSMMAVGAILLGLALLNVWLICLGGFFLVMSQAGSPTQQALASREADALKVRDVMLTDFSLMSASDTLSGAIAQSVHSLQDVFPVVRGDLLVGAIARSTLFERLQASGDAYVQGVMTRSFPLAAPEEKLVDAHRRASGQGAAEFIPVVEGEALVGILTPQSLSRAVTMLRPNLSERLEPDHE